MEWLENRVTAEINEDIISMEEVAPARDQVCGFAATGDVQNVGWGKSDHGCLPAMDFHHTAEHNAAQTHAFHCAELN